MMVDFCFCCHVILSTAFFSDYGKVSQACNLVKGKTIFIRSEFHAKKENDCGSTIRKRYIAVSDLRTASENGLES